jgi:ferredoxin
MALKINDLCVNCWACVAVCPTESIVKARKHFVINPTTCTECKGAFEDPQCASICPIEGAIVDQRTRRPLNPPGSLTGIPPELVEQVAAEMRAR